MHTLVVMPLRVILVLALLVTGLSACSGDGPATVAVNSGAEEAASPADAGEWLTRVGRFQVAVSEVGPLAGMRRGGPFATASELRERSTGVVEGRVVGVSAGAVTEYNPPPPPGAPPPDTFARATARLVIEVDDSTEGTLKPGERLSVPLVIWDQAMPPDFAAMVDRLTDQLGNAVPVGSSVSIIYARAIHERGSDATTGELLSLIGHVFFTHDSGEVMALDRVINDAGAYLGVEDQSDLRRKYG